MDKELLEAIKVVLEARRIPKEEIEEMDAPYRYQFARVRDDIEV